MIGVHTIGNQQYLCYDYILLHVFQILQSLSTQGLSSSGGGSSAAGSDVTSTSNVSRATVKERLGYFNFK